MQICAFFEVVVLFALIESCGLTIEQCVPFLSSSSRDEDHRNTPRKKNNKMEKKKGRKEYVSSPTK